VLEVHDFSLPKDSNNDQQSNSDSSNDGDDDYLSHDVGRGLLHPWPRVYMLAGAIDTDGNLVPSLHEGPDTMTRGEVE
jgi:hypothetical protein